MIVKRILCQDRLRRLPPHYSWVDHRLVRNKHICGITHHSLALYLFLVTVCDADGISYYSDDVLYRYLDLDSLALSGARKELSDAGLIAYSYPLYQVLSLDKNDTAVEISEPSQRAQNDLTSLSEIFRQVSGGVKNG